MRPDLSVGVGYTVYRYEDVLSEMIGADRVMTNEESKRVLGVHYHQPAVADERGIRTCYAFGTFVDSIAPHFAEVVLFLHSPAKRDTETLGFHLRNRNIRLVPLGTKPPVYQRLFFARYYKSLFRVEASRIDVMLFRVSTVLLPFVARYFDDRVLYFVSHSSKGIEKLRQPWYRLILIKLWTRIYARHELAIAATSRCVTNNLELKVELERVLRRSIPIIPSTTLQQENVQEAGMRPLQRPLQVLSVGRVSYLKGSLDTINAVGSLHAAGHAIQLTFVGEFAVERSFKQEVFSYIEQHQLGNVVRFLGYVDGGEELWKIYQASDLLVIASRESEGFPRVIWEAMANSIPVLATRVGSIPSMAEDAVQLVPPKDAAAMAQGMLRVLNDEACRRRLVDAGFELVKDNTLEKRGRELSELILDPECTS